MSIVSNHESLSLENWWAGTGYFYQPDEADWAEYREYLDTLPKEGPDPEPAYPWLSRLTRYIATDRKPA